MTKPKYSLKVGDKFTNPYAGVTAGVMAVDVLNNTLMVVLTPDGSNVGEIEDDWNLKETLYGLESGDYVMKD